MKTNIPFNKPYLCGNELLYIEDAVKTGKISGNGKYTKLCHSFFKEKYGFSNCLLTTSCTDALEMAAILINIEPGDEVIIPSYTFVSTANAFIMRGAKVVFADSRMDHPGIDERCIEKLITKKTKAIVPVHYAGIACDMDLIMEVAKKHKIFVIEDAAQAVDSYYINSLGEKKALGSIGHFAAFSFHETKNIISGEGGMLVINDDKFLKRAEIIWEKGTNRSAFFRGDIDKYGWVDIGSSFLPSDLISAFLFAQLENIDIIQDRRKIIWNLYKEGLKVIEDNNLIRVQNLPTNSTQNSHMFYIICSSLETRDNLINYLISKNIHTVFHYQSLHKSHYFINKHDGRILQNSDEYSNKLLRLPMFYELTNEQVKFITDTIIQFFK